MILRVFGSDSCNNNESNVVLCQSLSHWSINENIHGYCGGFMFVEFIDVSLW